jgi:hypothetical protein
MRVGGVNLESGKIINMVLESTVNPPSFNSAKAGEFSFSTSDRVLRFNDGIQFIALNTTISEDPNLKVSLGSNWLNEDLSFNPVPFNDLPNIHDLDSTSSLFDVIDQIAVLIDNASTITIEDIDVSQVVTPDMSVLAYNAGEVIFVEIEQVLEGSQISLTFDNLKGFDITDVTHGNAILFNECGDLVSKNVSFTYTMYTTSIAHTITHELGVKHCAVYCIDPATDMMVTPVSVYFNSVNELTVTLPASTGLKALVTNFDAPATNCLSV